MRALQKHDAEDKVEMEFPGSAWQSVIAVSFFPNNSFPSGQQLLMFGCDSEANISKLWKV